MEMARRALERAFTEAAGPPPPEPCAECGGPSWEAKSTVFVYGLGQVGECGTCGGAVDQAGRSARRITVDGESPVVIARLPEERRPK